MALRVPPCMGSGVRGFCGGSDMLECRRVTGLAPDHRQMRRVRR
jgi:hypothetical protein